MDSYRAGDIGGWALDLLQAWGVYARESQPGNVYDWMEANLGKNDESAFGYGDLVADVDAYLCALGRSDGGQLSSSMRTVYRQNATERIAAFYQQRFDSSQTNIADAFEALCDGMWSGEGFPVPVWALKWAAGLRLRDDEEGDDDYPMPTAEQARACGAAFGEVLSQLG